MREKILVGIFLFIMCGGFVLMIGTAGSADTGLLDFETILVQGGTSVILMLLGFIGLIHTAHEN